MPDTMIVQSVLFADMAGTFGAELLRFASRRMAAQAELLVGLSQCRTVQDLLDRQMDFMRCAGADYAEGFSTMAKLAQSTQPAATDPARGNAD
ncbi:MAG: phasin family protein [Acetobacteraceae bacterium]|nr:phasin family protein [Acetobacteraceae bacterium]